MQTIHGTHLTLTPVSPDDAVAVRGGDLSGLLAGDGWPHADTSDGLGMIASGSSMWFAWLDGVVIGDAGTHGPPDETGTIEIGYGLAAPFRGHGYGTDMVITLSRHLLAEPGIVRVVAETEPGNTPSRRALERAGFALTSESPEAVIYTLS